MNLKPTTKHVKIAKIILDRSKMARAEIKEATVADYAGDMGKGNKFPSVDLFRAPPPGDHFLIGDGWHRILAAKKNGSERIAAFVHEGTPADALKFALGANQKNGMRRTNEDKRNAVELALKEFGNWSSVQIADLCGVGHATVDRIRREQPDQRAGSPETRMGADGKVRRMPTEPVDTLPAPVPWKNPVATNARGETRFTRTIPKDYEPPDRGIFLARGAIAELKQIRVTDKEFLPAFIMVRDFCEENITKKNDHENITD